MTKVKVVYNSTSATALKLRGSVINHVAPKVIFFTIWSLFIFLLDKYIVTDGSLGISNSLISVLGLVISLLLVFRTNTAYDRYWEGRRLWSQLSMAVRTLTRIIWIHVEEKEGKYDLLVKRSAIDLLIGFSYACMYHLRSEYGVHSELCNYLSHFPDINQTHIANISEHKMTNTNCSAPRAVSGESFHLPLLITHHISSFIADVYDNKAISNPEATTLITNVNMLVFCLSGFERILTTPIPVAYAVHLSQSLWLFCLFLPFQVIGMFKAHRWVMVLVVALTAFTMFGIVNIGEEIENPFGLDANDLPLNEYCTLLAKEINSIIRYPPPKIDDWVFSKQDSFHHQEHLTVPSSSHSALTVHM